MPGCASLCLIPRLGVRDAFGSGRALKTPEAAVAVETGVLQAGVTAGQGLTDRAAIESPCQGGRTVRLVARVHAVWGVIGRHAQWAETPDAVIL